MRTFVAKFVAVSITLQRYANDLKIQNLDILSTQGNFLYKGSFYTRIPPAYTIRYVSISTASITTKFAIVAWGKSD